MDQTPETMQLELPYVDHFISRLERGDDFVMKDMGQHMHWGYWSSPHDPDISPEGFLAAADEMARLHFRMAEIRPGMKVLDVGCGFGGAVALLNREYRDLDITGLNIDARQVAWANKATVPQAQSGNAIRFDVGDACALPYEDSSLDAVYAIECIFHFSSRRRFLQEAKRVLKPHGKLVVSDSVCLAVGVPVMAAMRPFFINDVRKTYGEIHPPLTDWVYYALARNTGLRVTETRDVSRNIVPIFQALEDVYTPTLQGDLARSATRTHRFFELSVKAKLFRFVIYRFEIAS